MDRKPNYIDFVDRPYCHKEGGFTVATHGRGTHRPVDLDFSFGGTDIQIEGQASGERNKVKIDFMTN